MTQLTLSKSYVEWQIKAARGLAIAPPPQELLNQISQENLDDLWGACDSDYVSPTDWETEQLTTADIRWETNMYDDPEDDPNGEHSYSEAYERIHLCVQWLQSVDASQRELCAREGRLYEK